MDIEAAVFADGHDAISCRILHRFEHEKDWNFVSMAPIGNDRWRATFPVLRTGRYFYTVEGWIDRFKTWRADLAKRIQAAQDLQPELVIGGGFISEASERATGDDAKQLKKWSEAVQQGNIDVALSDELFATMQAWPDVSLATRFERELTIWVEPVKARFSTWYELFPRSASGDPSRHGTFRDCEARIPYVAGMGFDVLYLPPIHPIGETFRKGPNNTQQTQAGRSG